MYKELVFLCCAIAFILVSTTEAKGGRGGGGRSSGRSSSRSSSGGFFSSGSSGKSSSGSGGFFSSSSGSKSSSGSSGYSSSSSGSKSSSGSGGFFSRSSGSKSSSGNGGYSSSSSGSKSSSGNGGYSSSSSVSKSSSGRGGFSSVGRKSGSSFSGGWFHGFFHNSPYHYTYRPTHIVYGSSSSSSSNTDSYQTPIPEEEVEQKKETSDYAVGYSISKALSSDFFSIFNVVHDVSKYPEKIRSKELLSTTTQSPVATYDLNYIVNPPYTTTITTTYGYDPKSYYPDYFSTFNTVDSKKDLENNDGIQESVGNTEKVFEVTSTETTTMKVETKSYSPDDDTVMDGMNFKNGTGIDESIQKELTEMQPSTARNDLQESTTTKVDTTSYSQESTTTKVDTTSYSPDDNKHSKKMFELDESIMKDLEEGSFFATKESIDEMLRRLENRYRLFR